MLLPIKDLPHLFQDSATASVINMSDFRTFEIQTDLRKKRTAVLRPVPGEVWILEQWSILIHPWHEVIPPSITVRLEANELILADKIPLFRLAEPLQRSADRDLEKRVAALEVKLEVVPTYEPSWGYQFPLHNTLINQNHNIQVHIDGPADELMMLFEHTKHFLLCLRGKARPPAR